MRSPLSTGIDFNGVEKVSVPEVTVRVVVAARIRGAAG